MMSYNANMRKLTAKQQAFVDYVLNDGKTQTEAYMLAYGTKKKSVAQVKASQAWNGKTIQEYIEEISKEAIEKSTLSAQEIIQRYVKIVDASLFDVLEINIDEDGEYYLSLKKDADLKNVKSIKMDKLGRPTAIEMYDKRAVLDKLADIFDVAGEFDNNDIMFAVDDELERYKE